MNVVGSALRQFRSDNPAAWHDMMGAITESTVNHIRKAKQIGTSGALVSIMNGAAKLNSIEDYVRYSRPYDKRIVDALADTERLPRSGRQLFGEDQRHPDVDDAQEFQADASAALAADIKRLPKSISYF